MRSRRLCLSHSLALSRILSHTLAPARTDSGSQGSNLRRCVVDVRKSPFAHGHQYVALGRVYNRHGIRVLTSPERCSTQDHALTKNVVWQELLLKEGAPPNICNRALRKRPAASK